MVVSFGSFDMVPPLMPPEFELATAVILSARDAISASLSGAVQRRWASYVCSSSASVGGYMGPVMIRGCFMSMPPVRGRDAELRGPLRHVLERLGVDGNAFREPLGHLALLGLAGIQDLALRSQVRDHGIDLRFQPGTAGEAVRIERDQQVPDLARVLQVLVHAVDVAAERHAVH